MNLRIGHGFDVHRLVEGQDLIIGGIAVPFEKGLEGHSDADVLLHAIMDALLGAAGLPDIGHQFPPSDPAYEHADSAVLLNRVGQMIRSAGFSGIVNIDATIMAEQPRMASYIPAMQNAIAEVLHISRKQVNIKATTTEQLGFIGRGEGIAASAVCLIQRDN